MPPGRDRGDRERGYGVPYRRSPSRSSARMDRSSYPERSAGRPSDSRPIDTGGRAARGVSSRDDRNFVRRDSVGGGAGRGVGGSPATGRPTQGSADPRAIPAPVLASTPGAAADPRIRSPLQSGHPNNAPPRQPHHSGPNAHSANKTASASVIVEASYWYMKYREAIDKLEVARNLNAKNEAHFANFPALREKSEGDVTKAEEELKRVKDKCNVRSQAMEAFFRSMHLRNQPPHDTGDTTPRTPQEPNPGGLSAIEQHIEKAVNERLARTGPSAEIEQLRTEIRQRDNDRRKELEFCRSSLDNMNKNWMQANAKQSFLTSAFEAMKETQNKLKSDVMNAEQLALTASSQNKRGAPPTSDPRASSSLSSDAAWHKDVAQKIASLQNRADQYEQELKKANDDLQAYQSQNQRAMQGLDEKLSSSLPASQSYVTRAEFSEHKDASLENLDRYVTKEEFNVGKNDNLELLKEHLLAVTGDVSDEIDKGNEKARGLEIQIKQDIEGIRSSQLQLQNQSEMLRNAIIRKEAEESVDIRALKTMLNGFASRLEGLEMGIKHCDSRLSDWSTKDFYEKVVTILGHRNPNFLGQGIQIAKLDADLRKLAAVLRSRVPAAHTPQQEVPPHLGPPMQSPNVQQGYFQPPLQGSVQAIGPPQAPPGPPPHSNGASPFLDAESIRVLVRKVTEAINPAFADLQTFKQDFQARNQQLENDRKAQEVRVRALIGDMEKFTDHVQNLRNTINETSSTHRSQVDTMENRIQGHSADLEEIRKVVQKYRTDQECIQRDIREWTIEASKRFLDFQNKGDYIVERVREIRSDLAGGRTTPGESGQRWTEVDPNRGELGGLWVGGDTADAAEEPDTNDMEISR